MGYSTSTTSGSSGYSTSTSGSGESYEFNINPRPPYEPRKYQKMQSLSLYAPRMY